MMVVGITGFPFSGKSTFLKLMAKVSNVSTDGKEVVGKLPDENLKLLSEVYGSKKTTPISVEFVEIGSVDPQVGEKERTQTIVKLQEVDAVLIILRAFQGGVPLPEGYEDPVKQLEYILEEMLLRDLGVLETRIERLENAKRKLSNIEEIELKLLERVKEHMEEKGNVMDLEMNEEEKKLLQGFAMTAFKRKAVLVNLGETEAKEGYKGREELKKLCERERVGLFEMPLEIALELYELGEEEREDFIKEYGVENYNISDLMGIILDSLDMMVFYTAGEREARAWEVKKGATALDAAARIHTDLARGFIRAEVYSIKDLRKEGSIKALKEKGLIHVVGKDHPLKDGDVVYIRFNV